MRNHLFRLCSLCCLLVAAAHLTGGARAAIRVGSHAHTGPQITLSALALTPGGPTNLVIHGTGFTPNATVLVTFNAPYSISGAPLVLRSSLPAVNRPGDNQERAPGSGFSFPNNIQVLGNTDVHGGLGFDPNFGQLALPLPPTTMDGTYGVSAVDLASQAVAFAQYTVARNPLQALQLTPQPGAAVPVGGAVHVVAAGGTFNHGDVVKFFLEDFAATASLGLPNVPFGSFTGMLPPAAPSLPLKVLQCDTPAAPLTPPDACSADSAGSAGATVQLAASTSAVPPPAPLLSTFYYHQVYAIVAQAVANVLSLPPSFTMATAGLHLDHGHTQLTLNPSLAHLGTPLTVTGSGFGSGATIALYFVTPGAASTCALDTGAVYFSSPCLLGTLTADAVGAVGQTVTLPQLPLAQSVIGYVLAEDFAPGTYPGAGAIRLNAGATRWLALVIRHSR